MTVVKRKVINIWCKAIAVIVVLTVSSLAVAQALPSAVEVFTDGQKFEVTYTATFAEEELGVGESAGYDLVRMEGCDWVNQAGKPMLPAKEIRIALPQGMAVTGVRLLDTRSRQLLGEYTIFPAQPPVRVSDSRRSADDFIAPDAKVYASVQAYPADVVEFVRQSDLAGQGIATVRLHPLQYIPARKTLQLYTEISFVLEGVAGYECGDYLPKIISARGEQDYIETVQSMVVNPTDVALTMDPGGARAVLSLPAGGPYDYVIIGVSSDQSYWQPLVDWRTKRGMKATYVTTTYIYSNYSGADNQEKIRNFVIDARNNWGTLYFLIAGENGDVPFEYRSYNGDSIPSDQYYGDYDDDWDYEVYVGRVTASSSTEIDTFIDKIFMYEITPPLTNYVLDVTMLGMDVTTIAWDGYLTRGQNCKETIDNYIPARFTVDKIYDTDSSNHLTDFTNALNDGQNLVNHYDHSGPTAMGCGDRNHGWYLYRSGVNNLTNNNRLCNVFSIGCHANELDYSDCIAERFVVFNPLQAGVSFTGNTRSGWFYVEDPDSLSGELDKDWWYGLFSQNKYILGQTLAYTKNVNSSSSTVWRYCQWTLNLLGDPAMPLWTDDPQTMTVTHDTTLNAGESTAFPVLVESGGSPVYQALVCLWKNGDIYETLETNISGYATFLIETASTGTMYVTVTKRNYLPHESQVTVQEAPEYTLTVNISGNGSVDRDPNWATYPDGQDVELTAYPDLGWSFDHWEDDLGGSDNPEIITMDDDKTVTAVFTHDEYTLTVSSIRDIIPIYGVPITVTPNDNYSHGDGETEFQRVYCYGEPVTLTAPDSYNYRPFVRWIVGGVEQPKGQRTVVVDVEQNIEAVAKYTNKFFAVEKMEVERVGPVEMKEAQKYPLP